MENQKMFLNHLENEISLCNGKLKQFFDVEKDDIFYWETRLEVAESQKKNLIRKISKIKQTIN